MLRNATIRDIERMHQIRLSVKENVLHTPSLVTYEHYQNMLTRNGMGWVYELNNDIVGFAIIDLSRNNVWALFVDPAFEGRGIGRKLHNEMVRAYFLRNDKALWLTTSPATRAEYFYRAAGWKECGMVNGELKFELPAKHD